MPGTRHDLNSTKIDWSSIPGIDQFMKEAWNNGASASRVAVLVADRFGLIVSRNAVIGRLTRQGVTGSGTANPNLGPRPKRANNPRTITRTKRPDDAPANKTHARRIREAPAALKKIEQAPLIAPDQSHNVMYADLGETDCSWPISGSGMDMVCCGGKQMIKASGRRAPYCAFHMKVQGIKT